MLAMSHKIESINKEKLQQKRTKYKFLPCKYTRGTEKQYDLEEESLDNLGQVTWDYPI